MKDGISVCFIIKNGITQGYPFWESLKSCLPFANEIVISEGNSSDETATYINKFASIYGSASGNGPTIRLFRDEWTKGQSGNGEIISIISEKNMRRCTYNWIYYLQADEIVHEGNVDFIKSIASKNSRRYNAVEFYFWHFLGSWNPVKSGAAYHEAIRMVKNNPKIKLMGDGWTFEGDVSPVCKSVNVPHPLFHLGWVFPHNCDQKHLEHGKIYAQNSQYQKVASEAKDRLSVNKYEEGYSMPSDTTGFPSSISRLFGKVRYELPEEALS